MNTNIYGEFQIYFSVPLNTVIDNAMMKQLALH